jgi:acetoacetyl-CoA reductase
MKNKVALVTGGTGGLGTAICRYLAAQGAKVAAGYYHGGEHEKARTWQKTQQQEGYDIAIVFGDVSQFETSQNLVETVEQQLGPIDILVNNAGITRDTQLKNMNLQQWQEVMRTNMDSVFNVTRHVINGMISRNYGRIINISSVNGQKGQFGQTNYSAAKAGIHGFTKALAQEVARKGVTVNTISPGYMATDMVMAIAEDIRQQIIAQIPVGRLGKPEEIARMVGFLASSDSGYITGANFAINGGQYMA